MDNNFIPAFDYTAVFDIYTNLQRVAPFLNVKTKKLLHLTGSDASYQNRAEIARVAALEGRKGLYYSPKRLVANVELVERSLRIADICSLIGNEHILNTYPEHYREKIKLVTVSASKLDYVKMLDFYVPEKKEFLWFFGSGAVHKGLDLVLDVFSRNPNIVLNVVGNVACEQDFWRIYRQELTECPNIKYHGRLLTKGEKFKEIMNNSFCFLAPSCSEGISTAVATCLQVGLFPIISRDCGVTLPENCGMYLDDCTTAEIEEAIFQVFRMNEEDLKEQIGKCQKYALRQFSREKFFENMIEYLSEVMR
jgi:hypothetical protein